MIWCIIGSIVILHLLQRKNLLFLKGALEGLRKLLASESPFKKMETAFYFTLKALFILMIFKFCPNFFVM